MEARSPPSNDVVFPFVCRSVPPREDFSTPQSENVSGSTLNLSFRWKSHPTLHDAHQGLTNEVSYPRDCKIIWMLSCRPESVSQDHRALPFARSCGIRGSDEFEALRRFWRSSCQYRPRVLGRY